MSRPSRTRDPRLAVAIGGGLGASLRAGLLLAGTVTAHGALGAAGAVLVVNLLGAYGLGWLTGRATWSARWAALVPLLGTGVAGALTTFSGLTFQSVRAAGEVGVPLIAAGTLLQVAAGVALATLGLRRGRGGRIDRR